ncbi:MAG: hypothetical protein HKO91_05450 [Desulfobacterales bacterium]|nr:hypothetical protein [Desulfobacterales bacterium]
MLIGQNDNKLFFQIVISHLKPNTPLAQALLISYFEYFYFLYLLIYRHHFNEGKKGGENEKIDGSTVHYWCGVGYLCSARPG